MNRQEAIEKALESYRQTAQKRTETIEYRGQATTIEVVTINAEVPLLNPNNSRLRAQLLSHPKGKLVAGDPNSPESQKVLESLLGQTDKFQALKQQLLDFDQQEPGIIARDGTLVNGNTRLAAIRQLGKTGFDVAVLPADATDEDFFQIEMSLQLRKLVHQDYTFTNELLLVDNYLARTGSPEATIQAMQWRRGGKKKLKEYQGYLEIIEELRREVPGLTYSFFDSKAELIRNLYSEYSASVDYSPSSAESMKWSRILGLFLGLNKDEIREIKEDFVEDELLPSVEDQDVLAAFENYKSAQDLDPIEALVDNEDPPRPYDLRAMALAVGQGVIDDTGHISDEKLDNYSKLRSNYRHHSRRIREERVDEENRREPLSDLKQFTDSISELAEKIPSLFSDEKFDKKKFVYQAQKMQKALNELKSSLDTALKDEN